jgi:hypothetical protein
MDKIKGEQPNCHFTIINEGDAVEAAPLPNSIQLNKSLLTKNRELVQLVSKKMWGYV